MKKRYILIIILIIIFGTCVFLVYKEQKRAKDETFRFYLEQADSCFEVDYSKLDEEDKISYYMKAAANLYTAIYMIPSTSYNVKNGNHDLQDGLSKLYVSITLHTTPQSTNRLKAFNEKEHDIDKCLYFLSLNPKDKNKCKELVKIAEDIGY